MGGYICGYRVEEIENPVTQKVRYLNKLVDELAKGRKMEKILGCGSGVRFIHLNDVGTEFEILPNEVASMILRPALLLAKQVEVFDQLLSLAVGLESQGMTNHGFSAWAFVKDKKSQLIRCLQRAAGFVDRLPRNDSGGTVLPCVQSPCLNVAVGLMDMIGRAIYPRSQTIAFHTVRHQPSVVLEGP